MADRLVTTNRVRAALTLVLVLLLAGLALRGCGPTVPPPSVHGHAPLTQAEVTAQFPETERITIAGRAFELELALTEAQRYQGLSDRAWIPEDGGMLFVFPDAARRAFVMRRCLVPIDLVYLDADGRVLNMHRMEIEPYDRPEWMLRRYRSDGPAQYVIELAGGTLDELELARGDRVEIPSDLKRRAE